ncbi:acyltransferase family protein [Terrabacter sp. NPDC000476]|uniref:acyltransferase family protein n=1 Tax=Terrabacter sp. NPDC000476 TaxID=3154258 RepID=UPI00331815C7
MPRPVEGGRTYLPALDGVRALAVGVVVGYHLGIPWLPGGLLGVGVFFTLSGFLITSILLTGWESGAGTGLRRFWVRRARRLLPAVIIMLAVVVLTTAVVEPSALGRRGVQALSSLGYVSNWQTIAAGDSYFQRISGPGPLDHLWSLAVEEQFYVVWPVLLIALIVCFRGRLALVARATVVLAGASFILLGVVATAGFDNTRAYEGTDTRAGALLLGAAVALVWRPGHLPELTRRAEQLRLDGVGLFGLVLIAVLVGTVDEYSMFLYRGGILLLCLATAMLVAAISHPVSLLARPLGTSAFVWLGERSYGIYLWHLPVIAFTPTGALSGHAVLRGLLQTALIVVLAALSWSFVEDPVRRHGFRHSIRGRGARVGTHFRSVPAVVAGAIVVVLIGTTALSATALVDRSATDGVASIDPDDPPVPTDAKLPTGTTTSTRPPATTPSRATGAGALETSCTRLVHVGDSTSVGLVDKDYLPQAGQRLPAQYARIGVKTFTPDILGARSIVERYRGQPNAQEAVASRTAQGYAGCWVLAMGTNEVANQYVGGVVPLADRIDALMQPIGDRPVLWLTVKTLRRSGPWGEDQMKKWNRALRDACERYPGMRVYDWASEVRDSWFVDDDIHFTSRGYAERAERTADAVARAFPRSGTPAGGSGDACVVSSGDR